MPKRLRSVIRKFPTKKQKALDRLLAKQQAGRLEPDERTALHQLVQEAEQWMTENARRLLEQNKEAENSAAPPLGAVPVTVWVHGASAEH